MTAAFKLFISYSRAQTPFVDRLADELRRVEGDLVLHALGERRAQALHRRVDLVGDLERVRAGKLEDGNAGGGPNYWPNSFGGPAPDSTVAPPPIDVAGMAARYDIELTDVDFQQAGELYRKAMSDQDRANLVGNIVAHLLALRALGDDGLDTIAGVGELVEVVARHVGVQPEHVGDLARGQRLALLAEPAVDAGACRHAEDTLHVVLVGDGRAQVLVLVGGRRDGTERRGGGHDRAGVNARESRCGNDSISALRARCDRLQKRVLHARSEPFAVASLKATVQT